MLCEVLVCEVVYVCKIDSLHTTAGSAYPVAPHTTREYGLAASAIVAFKN